MCSPGNVCTSKQAQPSVFPGLPRDIKGCFPSALFISLFLCVFGRYEQSHLVWLSQARLLKCSICHASLGTRAAFLTGLRECLWLWGL